jgi:acetyl-CoA C-acetyltransferase
MGLVMNRKVVITGWGQITQPKEQAENLLDPLGLMVAASQRAAEIAGSSDILKNLDGIMVVRVMSRNIPSAAKRLAEAIGVSPRFTLVSGIGGNSPQSMVNKASGMIARGELDSVLIAGGETYYPRNEEDSKGTGTLFKGLVGENIRDDMIGVTSDEMQHGIYLPLHGFPLFETALWGQSGMDLNSYMEKRIGNLWSRFSQTAAIHPNAWIKTPKTSSEILSPGPDNRMIAFPYPKFLNPIITVDLGAAVILMSEEKSKQGRQPNGRPVYFLAGAYAQDRQQYIIEKSDFTQSKPIKEAAERSFKRSGLTMDNIDCFDIYSCFPCAVSMACRMIGLAHEEKRPLTLTGGLGFFGGPGNNYSLHAIATLADAISRGQYSTGMITSLGWFFHKNAVGIYSATPKETNLSQYDLEDEKECLVGDPPVPIEKHVSGKGIIETYTIIYSKDGSPSYGVVYGKTEQGFRFIAQTPKYPDVFEALSSQNQVVRDVRLSHDATKNLNIAELL